METREQCCLVTGSFLASFLGGTTSALRDGVTVGLTLLYQGPILSIQFLIQGFLFRLCQGNGEDVRTYSKCFTNGAISSNTITSLSLSCLLRHNYIVFISDPHLQLPLSLHPIGLFPSSTMHVAMTIVLQSISLRSLMN